VGVESLMHPDFLMEIEAVATAPAERRGARKPGSVPSWGPSHRLPRDAHGTPTFGDWSIVSGRKP
jgi:hypothetical protein